MRTVFEAVAATAFAACVIAASAFADSVVLKSGQTLEGTVLESGGRVSVVLPYATISFDKDEISSIQYGPTPVQVYKERSAAIADNDAAGHYELGLYCEEKKLISQARGEYEKAVIADPNHEGARIKLGYTRVDGKWFSHQEYMESRGFVLRKGRYVTPEQAAEQEARDAAAAGERDARNLVRTLAYMIASSDSTRSTQAQERMLGLSDPAALMPLIEQLLNQSPAVRTSALLALLNYREDEAALAALDVAIYDDLEAVRYQARIILSRKQSAGALRSAIATLAVDDDDVRFLTSQALGSIGHPAAIPQLIEYLSWTRDTQPAAAPRRKRERKITPSYVAGVRAKVAPGVVAFEPVMGGFDSRGRRVILGNDGNADTNVSTWTDEVVLNYEALTALKAITGQDFRFDKDIWRSWYIANRQRLEQAAAALGASSGAESAIRRE